MDDEIKLVIYGLIAVFLISVIIDWYGLNQFKKCYDKNFQDTYCQRYLQED